MKELDLVLMRYLRERWPTASGAERDLFERVLDLPDPELAACLMGRATAPDRELQAMLELLRGASATSGNSAAVNSPRDS